MEKLTVKNEYPPNYDYIKQFFPAEAHKAIFAYGQIIYNPFKVEIPPDVEVHEATHTKQQKSFATPDLWWLRYCTDTEFRKWEEVEAYANQYKSLKAVLREKVYRLALDEFAEVLSGPLYNLGITKNQAHSLIKRKAK